MLEFAFGRLHLNRVEAMFDVRNRASGRVMEKCGMRREGLLRQKLYNKGEYVDVEDLGDPGKGQAVKQKTAPAPQKKAERGRFRVPARFETMQAAWFPRNMRRTESRKAGLSPASPLRPEPPTAARGEAGPNA